MGMPHQLVYYVVEPQASFESFDFNSNFPVAAFAPAETLQTLHCHPTTYLSQLHFVAAESHPLVIGRQPARQRRHLAPSSTFDLPTSGVSRLCPPPGRR